ncbi:MAG: hypothetical protein IJ068_05810 [Bacilli bacterium]|nr:hypothetical protein [Bacilli bacterium]
MKKIKREEKVFIIVIVLSLIGFGYLFYKGLVNAYNNDTEEKEEKPAVGKIIVYKGGNNVCKVSSDNCNEQVIIETETTDAEVLTTFENVFLYRDNGLKIYNTNTQEKININLEDDYNEYDVYYNSEKDKILGIYYEKNELAQDNVNKKVMIENGYFDIETQTKLYDKEEGKIYDRKGYWLLYNHENLKLFNTYTFETKKLHLEDSYKYYNLLFYYNAQNQTSSLKGIIYGDYEDVTHVRGFYNIETDKKMYENKFSEYKLINNEFMTARKFDIEPGPIDPHQYLLSIKDEKVLLYNENSIDYSIIPESSSKYFVVSILTDGYPYSNADIYGQNLHKIASNVSDYMLDSDEVKIYINDNNVIKIYDTFGNLISKIEEEKMLGLIPNHIVYIEDNKIKVRNVKNNAIYEIFEWNDNYLYQDNFSGYDEGESKIKIAIGFKNKMNSSGWFKNYDEVNGLEIYYDILSSKIETKDITNGYTGQIWD